MSLGSLVPLVAEVAKPIVAQAIANQKESAGSILGLNNPIPGLEVRAAMAESNFSDPEFWQSPKMDLEKALLIAVLGFAAGHILRKALR